MALSDTLGVDDGKVRITLNGTEVLMNEEYEVGSAIFEIPSHFWVSLGARQTAAELLSLYPAHTDFSLSVGGAVQFEGSTDGFSTSATGSSKRSIRLKGRDLIGEVVSASAPSEQSYPGKSTADLVKIAFDAAGANYSSIVLDNAASRKKRSGASILSSSEPIVPKTKRGRAVRRIHTGDSWFAMLKRELEHAGLFLWAGPNRTVVVSQPNTTQSPLYRLTRKIQDNYSTFGNIEGDSFDFDTSGRCSTMFCYGRGGGGNSAVYCNSGSADDPVMQALGYKRKKSIHDPNITSPAEGIFYAQRKLAQTRREGFTLHYTVAGHITPAMTGGNAVWTPDTMVTVDDDELGIHEDMWIESVLFRNNGGATSTELHVLSPGDLLFGDPSGAQ